MRPDAKVEKVFLYAKLVDFRTSIDGLTALVELDIKVTVFDPVLFVSLNKQRNRVKILFWERNGLCLSLKKLESDRFKTSPDVTGEAKDAVAGRFSRRKERIATPVFVRVQVRANSRSDHAAVGSPQETESVV